MEIKVYRDYNELSIQTAKLVAELIADKPNALMCFASGETSIGTFREIVRLYQNKEVSFSKCKIISLDEWVNLGEMKKENCYHFLKSHLFDLVDLDPKNICFFNGEADELQYECALADEFIKNNGDIDFMLLGVGMNGHIGFNEPGTPFDKYSHIIELDEITKSVGQKYFSEYTKFSRGITLGMKHVMEAKIVVLQISGQKKSHIVKRLYETEVTSDFPVSLIKEHPNVLLLLDSDASAFKRKMD